MRKTKKSTEVKTVIKTVDILCNICGKSCDNHKRKKGKKQDPMYDEYSGLIEAEVSGGYMSERIGDLCATRFSICEHCLVDKIFPMFKIPREMRCDLVSFQPEPKYHQERRKKEAELKKLYSSKE